MLRADAESSPWNEKELLERVDGDRELLCDLLRMFREDAPAGLAKANSKLTEGDMTELSRAAHGLKGMFKNLSMNRAAEAAYVLEEAAREERREKVAESYQQLALALREVLPMVEAKLAEAQA